ncbi:hypothetical protein [Enterobacter cancerogenus]|uniref:hypothetical protein n=1 Tax=Enterobacter cancerogenus TaxID=69218 RepID=UPI0034D25D47
MPELKQYFPCLIRIAIAPLGFVLLGIMALSNLDFGSFAWSGYERSYPQLLMALCINTVITSAILVACYAFMLKITRTLSLAEFVTGALYICSFQLFFIFFTMADCVVVLKSTIEGFLSQIGEWRIDQNYPQLETQKEVRDTLIAAIYLVCNSALSMLLTRGIIRHI